MLRDLSGSHNAVDSVQRPKNTVVRKGGEITRARKSQDFPHEAEPTLSVSVQNTRSKPKQ